MVSHPKDVPFGIQASAGKLLFSIAKFIGKTKQVRSNISDLQIKLGTSWTP